MKARTNPLAGFKTAKGASAGVEILNELRDVNRIVSEKATANEAAAFREWLLTAGGRRDAAKKGGFLGLHAERVSAGERRMLDKLSEGERGARRACSLTAVRASKRVCARVRDRRDT